MAAALAWQLTQPHALEAVHDLVPAEVEHVLSVNLHEPVAWAQESGAPHPLPGLETRSALACWGEGHERIGGRGMSACDGL